jgi:hypothetical protein
VAAAAALTLLASPLWAQFERCRNDQIKAGSVCIDAYEASVWSIPDPTTTNRRLVKKLQLGTATAADLAAAGAAQVGVTADDYGCADNGSDCKDAVFAASIAGVVPSAYITWFQAQAACGNALKRLPSNAEWQLAAFGSPDPDEFFEGPCGGGFQAVATGSRTGCVSSLGAHDMVGNLSEWVADWLPASALCPGWGGFSDDQMCLAGVDTMITSPHALVRGASFLAFGGPDREFAGPLTVITVEPFFANPFGDTGFRCAR